MLKELFEALTTQAVKAATPTLLDLDWKKQLVVANGTCVERVKLQLRQHVTYTIASFNAGVEKWCEEGTVWHHRSGLCAIVSDCDRFDRITLELVDSDEWDTLENLRASGLDQKAFISLLRNELAGTGVDTLLPSVRRVEFSSKAVSDRQKESLGASVSEAVATAGDLPENLTLSVPVYSNPDIQTRVPVACTLDVDLATQRFVLLPLPGELERGVYDVQLWIGKQLREDCFYGKPD